MSEELRLSPANSPSPATASGISILTAAQFRQLAEVPPEIEWFANIDSVQSRRAYQNDLRGFMQFAGIHKPEDFRIVTRSHVLAWRKTWKRNNWLAPVFAGNWRPCHPCSSTCARTMPSRTIQSRG